MPGLVNENVSGIFQLTKLHVIKIGMNLFCTLNGLTNELKEDLLSSNRKGR